jgi:SAM-dependent methyltransferase
VQHEYDSGFMAYADKSSRYSAQVISSLVREALHVTSVLDVGCARGTWLRAWKEAGVHDFQGVDGAYVMESLVIPHERFLGTDLAGPINLARRFDLVQSLEVAEHIPPESAEQFVDNLVAHSAGFVLFSAAPPGQGGEHHVNEQPYEYWREKFGRRGFQAFDYVRPRIAGDGHVSFWYRFNILLYADERRVEQLPEIVRSARIPAELPIPDVSPTWFRARKQLVRLLPRHLQQKLAALKARHWRRRAAS